MGKTGLVLEGGGLRGIYTCGVLDAFLDMNIEFDRCYGVSAGVCNAVSYIAKQKGRNYQINMKYINDKRYLSIDNYIKTGSVFGAEILLHLLPDVLEPFDYETYEAAKCHLIAVALDCETGAPVYYDLKGIKSKYTVIQATTAIPFVSKMIEYDGKKLMDGSVIDAIPVKKSIEQGYEKNVVILTRHKAYFKKPSKLGGFVKLKYKDYPKLQQAMCNRHNMYNETLKLVDKLEAEGKIFVIRPQVELKVSRFERDRTKLKWAYELGRADAFKHMERLKRFLDLV